MENIGKRIPFDNNTLSQDTVSSMIGAIVVESQAFHAENCRRDLIEPTLLPLPFCSLQRSADTRTVPLSFRPQGEIPVVAAPAEGDSSFVGMTMPPLFSTAQQQVTTWVHLLGRPSLKLPSFREGLFGGFTRRKV
jgi:hypothetical protein